jgi:hypothetical protein
LFILSVLILDSSVDGRMLSFAAAPVGPDTWPRVSANAVSINAFSWVVSIWTSGWLAGKIRSMSWDSQLSSTENVSVSQRITERSITFCNSRTFPGQGYD